MFFLEMLPLSVLKHLKGSKSPESNTQALRITRNHMKPNMGVIDKSDVLIYK
jgi:hypothetical protein